MTTKPLSHLRHTIRRGWTYLLIGLCAWLALPAYADVSSGLQWLDGRETATGVHLSTDIAELADTNAEAWLTVSTLSESQRFPLLGAAVLTGRDQSSASLAKLILIRIGQGQSSAELIAQILALQNGDGGFGARAGYQSEALTTAFVLLALDRAGQGGGTPAGRAVGFLLSAQQSDGGFLSVAGNLSSVYASSQVAMAYAKYRTRFDLGQAISRVRTFLETARRPDQGFGQEFETASALEALIAIGTPRSGLANVATTLWARQQPNGSFSNDAFATALALRALWSHAQPELPPTGAALRARVLAADTGLPISGVSMQFAGINPAALTSNIQGRFQSDTISAGAYQVTVSYPGMLSIEFALTLVAGRTIDLGDLRMVRGSGTGDYALVRGTVRAAESTTPIAGAIVALTNPATEAGTDADGRYQLLQVPPGPATLSVRASGYSSRTVVLTVEPRAVIDFTIELAAVTTPGSGATVRGLVRHANTGAPLAGVAINVTGAGSLVSASSGSDGRFQLTTSGSGNATITATLAGFDPVAVEIALVENQVFDFSPRMYPAGTTPVDANRATLTGVIVNQATLQPIERALVVATDPGGQKTAQTDASGRFTLPGLRGPNTSLAISADAFLPATVLVPLLPMETRDLGQIGLRPRTIDYYLPDLQISDSSASTTTPDSFALSQTISVDVTNRGTEAVVQDFTVLAFVDANGNGSFDAATEPEVGRTRVDGTLPISNTVSVAVAVNAQLAFRDAPVSFWVDAEAEVLEGNDDNNVASSLLACRIEQTPINAGTIVEAWRWQGLASNPQINSVNQVPSVTQLTDDNGDGVINAYDIPDIVFSAGRRSQGAPFETALVAISGDDGHEIWSRTNLRLSPFASVATGDIDNDGKAEIVAVGNYRQAIYAFENDGTLKWQTPLNGPAMPVPLIPPPPSNYDQPLIVNLRGDNEAEVILGREVFRGLTGEQLWEGEFDAGGDGGRAAGRQLQIANGIAAIAADLDLDGDMEVIAGRTAYDYEGRTLWHRGDIKPIAGQDAVGQPLNASGYLAVGNFNEDNYPELVLAIDDELYLLDHNGATLWGPKFSPDFMNFGAPALADIDADGLPEILVSSKASGGGPDQGGRLTVYESDGTVKRSIPIEDVSGNTSPTVFDFQNDGRPEIVHVDERNFRVLDAISGQELFKTRHTSRTVFEYPVVADVNGDRQADIILTGFDDDLVAGVTPGIRVFSARNGSWADAGSVWGSHAFHIDDVGEDSLVPLLETPSWLTHNTYRVQRSPRPDPLGLPDFTLGDLRIVDQGPGLDPIVTVRVGNAGPVDAHEPPYVSLYRGNPQSGGVRLKHLRLDTLRPARFQTVDFGAVPATGSGDLYAVVDYAERARECRESNNQRSVAWASSSGLGTLAVSTDKLSYRPGETVAVTAQVQNLGALPAGYRVEWGIRDAQNRTTATLTPLDVPNVPAGQTVSRSLNWPSTAVLAGSYVLAGNLLDAAGEIVDTASASFAIAGDANGPAGGITLTLSRSAYRPGEVPSALMRAQNLSAGEVIRAPEIVLSVSGPGGFALQRSLPFPDLNVGAFVDADSAIDGAATPGVYTVSARLRSRLSGLEYAADNGSFERLTDISASIQGFVDVARSVLPVGDQQLCLYTARNRGAAALIQVSLRRSVVQLDTGTAVMQQAFNADLVPGADYVSSDQVPTAGLAPGDYACVFEINNGSWTVLDSEPFTLEGLPSPGIDVTPTLGLQTSEAGQVANFTVRLRTQPTADVQIPLGVSDPTEFRLSATSLVFTSTNWSVPRQVTVAGVDDAQLDGDVSGTIVLAPAQSTDVQYAGVDPADVSALNLDNDVPSIIVSPTLVETNEGGSSATFTVSINGAPNADVQVQLGVSDATEWSVNRTSLTFTASNWQDAQTVTVTGLDDAEVDGLQTGSIELQPSQSADGRFHGIDPADVVARNADNDGAAIVVDPVTVTTAEGGSVSSFTVRLNAAPTSEVIVPIGAVDASEWEVLDLDIRLNTGNWQAGRSVQVRPVDDAEVDGTQSATLTLAPAASSDARFNGVNPDDVTLINLDNDGPQILVNPTSGLIVSESGTSASFDVRLTVAPTEAVSLALSNGDPSEFALSTTTLSFAPGTMGPLSVTITGLDDPLVDGNIVGAIVLAPASSTDPRYQGLDPPDVTVTNLDDEVVQINVTPLGSIETTEAGTTASVSVRISAQPSADLLIPLSNPDTSEWQFDRGELRFTPANWASPQTLTVTGVNDFEIDGDALGTIVLGSVSSADPRYDGLDPTDVATINRDNDRAANISLQPGGVLETTEAGGSASFELRLSTEPTADVVLALSNPDTTEFALDRTEVRFRPADWNAPVTVRVTGVDDVLLDGDITGTIAIAPAVSTDLRFNGIDVADVQAINRNDDFVEPAALIVTAIDTSVSEAGDAGRIEIALNRPPAADSSVRVQVLSGNLGELTVAPVELTFSTANATTAQSVLLSGVDEFVDDGDQTVALMIQVSPDSDPAFAALAPIRLDAINVDNDTAGIRLAVTGPARIQESQSTTLAAYLSSRPTSAVTLTLDAELRPPGQPGDLIYALEPATVTFEPAQWQTPITLTLSTTDNRLANPDQWVDIDVRQVSSSDPLYAARPVDPVAVEVVDRGAYGLQAIPVNRWMPLLALVLILSGLWAVPRSTLRS